MNIAKHLRHPRLLAGIFLACLCLEASVAAPVKIFIMAGQSNMLGKGTISPVTTPGTLDYIVANDPAGKYQFLKSGANYVVRDDAESGPDPVPGGLTVGYGGEAAGRIGPELGFGHKMGDVDESKILIVKCAWGGKDLAYHFCPPSSRIGGPARDLRRKGLLLQGNPAAGDREPQPILRPMSPITTVGATKRRHVLARGMERPHRCRQECRLSDEHGELHQRHPHRSVCSKHALRHRHHRHGRTQRLRIHHRREGPAENGRYHAPIPPSPAMSRSSTRAAPTRISISGSRCRLPPRTRTITGTKTPRPISISVLPWVTRCP